MATTRFNAHFAVLVARANMPMVEFARITGISKSWPSNIASGRQKPPEDEVRLMGWAKALGLNAQEEDEFITLALLEHTPDRIRRLFWEMKGGSSGAWRSPLSP